MSYASLSNRQQAYITAILTHAPSLGIDTNKATFSRAELRQVSMTEKGKKWIPNWITHDLSRRADRGLFTIPEIREQFQAVAPGHGTVGDDLSDSVKGNGMAVADDMGSHVVSDDLAVSSQY